MVSLREQRTRALDYLHCIDLQSSQVLKSIMRYAFNDAEPLCASLVLWACDACGGERKAALPIAASIECLHRFNALHDELQMARALSVERQTTTSIWGLAQTLNAGDAFHAVALRMLAADAIYPDRALKVGTMLEETMLHGIELRSRLVSASVKRAGRGRRRVAYGGTQSLMLGSSLRAGAIVADAPSAAADALFRAGCLLGAAVQLAAGVRDGVPSPLARRYAVKAVSVVERSSLDRAYMHEFEEIAYHLASGS